MSLSGTGKMEFRYVESGRLFTVTVEGEKRQYMKLDEYIRDDEKFNAVEIPHAVAVYFNDDTEVYQLKFDPRYIVERRMSSM